MNKAILLAILVFLFTALAAEEEPASITMGNGEENWIDIQDVERSGNVLKFGKVQIAQPGWLVMHPFEGGAPNGDKVVAVSYLSEGTNLSVELEVLKGLEKGERSIVMLHKDINRDQKFDFIFVDDNAVLDEAVFEGSKMIGHVFVTP